MSRYIFILFLLTGLLACEPPVTFNEPQPVGTDNLLKFPKSLQGNFLSLADHSVLTIDNNSIQRIYDFDEQINLNQLDSNSRLSGDTVFDLKTNEQTLVKREGDSLIIHIHYTDTLFQLSQDNILKKFKGYYFLNTRYDRESWEVKKIQLSKGELTIGSISTKFDLDNLKEITENPQDTVPPYKFTATKKQFKQFVKNDGFSDSETFVKQKKHSS